jgi:hypothetical protein
MDEKRLKKLLEFPEPQEVSELQKFLNLFFFGTHGSWKTVTACQIGAHRGKVLHHSMDGDETSLHNHPEILRNVKTIPFQSLLHTKLMSEALLEQVPPFDQYSTFVFDTVSGYVDIMLETLTKTVSYGDNSRSVISPRPGVPGANQLIRDMDFVAQEFGDYGVAKNQLRPIVNNLIRAPMNVVFVSHDRVAEKDKGINWKHIRPDMPEAAFTVAVRKCDSLGFFKKDGEREPIISFKDAKNVTTKSRIGVLNGKELPVTEAVKLINEYLA